jgi:pilus assembly protein CpaE
MTPQTTTSDPFDLDFEADDDFKPPADRWAEADARPGKPADDPFADLPEIPRGERLVLPEDDFRPPVSSPEPKRPASPVGDLQTGANAAFGEPMAPRIAIHVFCALPETAEVAESAAADRRMERAATVVRTGGLAGALEHYRTQTTPPLLIVESLESGPQLLAGLDQLAEVCDPGTKVMVVGVANDISLYRELMRRGVSEYLVPPLEPLQMVRAVTSIYADPSAPFVGRQVTFCPAKGGVGSSTLAHNVAHSIAERLQTNAVLVDFDLAFGTAGLDFNQDPLQGIAEALNEPDRLDPVLMDRMMARCTDRLSLFAAPANLNDDYELDLSAYEEVAQKIRGAAPYIVLDLPHAWSAWKRRILISSDELVVVATPDLASLRNAKNIVDLVKRARPNDAPPRLVLNQVGVPGRPEIPAKEFGEAIGVAPAVVIPFEPKLFGQAANNGQMLADVGVKGSKAVEGVDHLAEQISRREPPPAEKASLLSGLFKRK